jgi:hypothetical protein
MVKKSKKSFTKIVIFIFMFKLNDLWCESQIKIFTSIYNVKLIHLSFLSSSYKKCNVQIIMYEKNNTMYEK